MISIKKIIFLSVLLLIENGYSFSQNSSTDFTLAEPDSLQNLTEIKLWATQYYIHQFAASGTIPVKDEFGNSMCLTADTCNFCEAALEGTAYITDSLGDVHVINFAKTGKESLVDCSRCAKYSNIKIPVGSWGKTLWKLSEGFGDGVLDYRLIPFRTIAVDPQKIPYGTVIYIPDARGKTILLPNGDTATHDGYFFAGDTGGAIKDDHIDVFTGIYEGNPFEGVVTSNSAKKFKSYLVSENEITLGLFLLHGKK